MAPFSDFVSTAISEGIDYWKAPHVRSSLSTTSPAGSSTCPSHIEVVKNILAFFALNIGAHAVTALHPPGQRWPAKLGTTLGVAATPVLMRMWYFDTLLEVVIGRGMRMGDQDQDKNKGSGAGTDTGPRRVPWHERLMDKIFGNPGDTGKPLHAAIDVGAVAVRFNPRFRDQMAHWKQVPLTGRFERRDALYIDGRPVSAAEDVRIVPVGTTTTSEARVKASSSVLNLCVAVGQLAYGVIELWASTRPEVRERGLASPFVVIIPYIWMSFVNILINMCVDSYPYIIVLQELEAAPEIPSGPSQVEDDRSNPSGPAEEGSASVLRNADDNANSTSLQPSSQSPDGPPPVNPEYARLLEELRRHPFRAWLKKTYALEPSPLMSTYEDSSAMVPEQATPWFGLLACYGPVTLILYGVARMAVPAGKALVAAAFLCWIYSAVAQSVLLLVVGGPVTVVGFMAVALAKDGDAVGHWVGMVLRGMVGLTFVAPVAPGVYYTIVELWKYYNVC